jgi:hypothetical protein
MISLHLIAVLLPWSLSSMPSSPLAVQSKLALLTLTLTLA